MCTSTEKKLSDLLCPFCKAGFELPDSGEEYLDTDHPSSCGCGALYCLALADEIQETQMQITENASNMVLLSIRNVDFLKTYDECTEEIVAIFWKNKSN